MMQKRKGETTKSQRQMYKKELQKIIFLHVGMT